MFKLLDTVALICDITASSLRRGDLGVIVELQAPGVYEVEFVAGSGRTQAIISINEADIRPLDDHDLIAVRSLAAAR